MSTDKLIGRNQSGHSKIINLSQQRNGRVSVADIYANSDLTIEQIEKYLSELVSLDQAYIEIDQKNGAVIYIINSQGGIENPSNFPIEIINVFKNVFSISQEFHNSPLIDLEKLIIQIAEEYNGKLTLNIICQRTGLRIEEAQFLLKSIANKGLCKIITENEKTFYHFPEINNLQTISESKEKNIILKFLKQFQSKQQDFYYQRVNRFYRVRNNILLRETILPGWGHLADKRWKFNNLFLFSVLPLFLTGGLIYLPLAYWNRTKTAKHYQLQESNQFTKSVQTKTITQGLIFYILYYLIIGSEGLASYFNWLLSFFN